MRDAILLILSTGFCFGFFVAFILNLVLPEDRDEPDATMHLVHYADQSVDGQRAPGSEAEAATEAQ